RSRNCVSPTPISTTTSISCFRSCAADVSEVRWTPRLERVGAASSWLIFLEETVVFRYNLLIGGALAACVKTSPNDPRRGPSFSRRLAALQVDEAKKEYRVDPDYCRHHYLLLVI